MNAFRKNMLENYIIRAQEHLTEVISNLEVLRDFRKKAHGS